jgi:2-dehydropantoate 2-reductase
MRARGLSVLGPRGDIHLNPVQATDDPSSIGPVDYVLFCVKLWDVESAGAAVRPLVGPTTAVIPLQNGIDASERLIPILGKDAVMGGVAQISATVAEPGVIRQTGTFMRLVFGELDGRPSQRGAAFHALCRGAGFDRKLFEALDDIKPLRIVGEFGSEFFEQLREIMGSISNTDRRLIGNVVAEHFQRITHRTHTVSAVYGPGRKP